MAHRKTNRKLEHRNYEEQIIHEASLLDRTYRYHKIEPTVFFWKELAATQKDNPICLVPDTLILNDKDIEIMWIFTNEQGRISKDLNVNFKDFVSKVTNYSTPNELVAIVKRPIFHEELSYTN